MTNGRDRRRSDTEAAHRRRQELQQRWEQSHTTGPDDHITERFALALGGLIDASGRLPVCARSAKLNAAISRLTNAPNKPAACAAARALLGESELALEADPWFRFHRAATEAVATLCEAA
jgi:hypothetical protein